MHILHFHSHIQSGIFPDAIKLARVIPFFKTGDKGSFSNYRPVSLLPQFSKIIEKLLNKRLDTFLEANQVLTSSQYGFRNKASTSHALLDLHEQLTKSMDEKLKTIGTFIDLKKVFDTIDHSLLIKKLNIYGIRGVASSWITSYLDKRSQYVYYNDVKSDTPDISCGVPQGSILGSKLFILYINDMVNVSKLFKFIIFADDTNLFCSNRDIVNLRIMVCHELSKLETWFALNKLSLNDSKTNYIIFSHFKINHDIQLFIVINVINRVSETKFLAVIIDDNLNCHSHIIWSYKWSLQGAIQRIFYCKESESCFVKYSLNMLYNSMCLPYISYCCEIWGNSSAYALNKILLLKKKCIRMVH